MKLKPARTLSLQPRLRVRVGATVALGPGKAELLQLVQQTGSIREAAQRMEMSYMRAWTLIKTMNECFAGELVVASRGGKQGGGAELTDMGRELLLLYQKMERDSLQACQGSLKRLAQFLRK